MAVQRRRATGFTLMELLVVVAIVTILIAILLPAISRARAQAQQAHCAANLRTLGQAMTMYTHQYGYYLPLYFFDGKVFGAVWPARLLPFLGRDKGPFYCPGRDERCRWTDDEPPYASDSFIALGYEPGESVVHDGKFFSYGYNSGGAGGKGLGDWVGVEGIIKGAVRVNQVRMPEEMIAVTDSNADGKRDFAINPLAGYNLNGTPWWPIPGRVHPTAAHSGGANVLFCDGHVAWFPQQELLIDHEHVTPKELAKSRTWNYDHEPMPWR